MLLLVVSLFAALLLNRSFNCFPPQFSQFFKRNIFTVIHIGQIQLRRHTYSNTSSFFFLIILIVHDYVEKISHKNSKIERGLEVGGDRNDVER